MIKILKIAVLVLGTILVFGCETASVIDMINKETNSIRLDGNFNNKKLAPYKINEVLVFPVIRKVGEDSVLNKDKYLLQIIMIKAKQNKSSIKIKKIRP